MCVCDIQCAMCINVCVCSISVCVNVFCVCNDILLLLQCNAIPAMININENISNNVSIKCVISING